MAKINFIYEQGSSNWLHTFFMRFTLVSQHESPRMSLLHILKYLKAQVHFRAMLGVSIETELIYKNK